MNLADAFVHCNSHSFSIH